ncbi:hypothetical protein [Aquimarina intermedia]|uniref:Uncharacterized protein n=1 Tax=Aquimarina intermedia TaxID=350814 RepID=A0A5S5CGV9_9FLAO|nr:hypothetical protein [Aquimarina intermedia]TYP77253.1 hypothetical protein BD809_101405 [Aquimarina intermedia]
MKKQVLLLAILSATLISCDVNQKKEAKLPDVDVDIDAEEGQLPTYDVDWADVNVGTKTKTIKVPKVVVVMEEEEVEVPYIDLDMPNEGEKEEMSIVVETEVSGKEHDIEIQEIRADGKRLYVISKLEALDTDLGDKTMRIQDQIEINAPDLDIKHIIVGERPDRTFNGQYTYVGTMNDFNDRIKNAKVIYKR